MKKFEIDGSVLRIPTPFIKHLLKYRKRYRYMIEYFGNCETFEVWTKKLFGIEFIYSRKRSARRRLLISKDSFSKDPLSVRKTSVVLEKCNDSSIDNLQDQPFLFSFFANGIQGPLMDCNTQSQDDQGVVLEFVFKEHSCSDTESTYEKIEPQENKELSDIIWIDNKWFYKSKLIDTGFSHQFNHFFLTRKRTLIKRAIHQNESINLGYQVATAEEIYLYALWISDKEGWATKIDPNLNNAL